MIKEYIDNQITSVQPKLNTLYKTITNNLPSGYVEKMSYGMPTFWYKENIIHFAVYKNHIGIYPAAKAMVYFENRLVNYKRSKGAFQIPIDDDIPVSLIADIVKYRIGQVNLK